MSILKKSLFLLASMLVGVCFPTFFVILDLLKLRSEINVENFLNEAGSHPMYIFSAVFFTGTTFLLGYLFLKLKESLHATEDEVEYFKKVLNTSPDGIIFFDSNLKPSFQNTKFKALGIDVDDFLKKIELDEIIQQGSDIIQKEIKIDSIHMQEHPFFSTSD